VTLKQALISSPVFSFPIEEGEFILDTDASHGLGAILSLKQEGEEKVVTVYPSFRNERWLPDNLVERQVEISKTWIRLIKQRKQFIDSSNIYKVHALCGMREVGLFVAERRFVIRRPV